MEEAWKRLIKWGYHKWLLGWKVKMIGIVHDNPEITARENIRYDACIVIKKEIKPEGEIGYKTIDGGRYAIFHYKGTYERFSEVYNYIFSAWISTAQVTLADRPAFEQYLNSPKNTKPEDLLTDIYIPLE